MLGWLRRRVANEHLQTSLGSAFRRIRDDMEIQRRLLEELHESHHGFRRSTSINHQRLADWIAYFESSIRRLDSDLRLLESKLGQELEAVKTTSLSLMNEAYSKHRKDLEAAKDEIKRELSVFAAQNASKQGIININNEDNVNNVMPEGSFDALSNPEKWLVGFLFNTETPLSYTQIAERTGKSINTVRVYMNQLKFKGFVEESALPNGTKIFSLKHKAKVKKLYNL